MATQEMTGTNKLAERILSDARADAEKTASEAAKSIASIQAESEKRLATKRAEQENKCALAVKSVLDGCKTRASLDGRKAALAKKRAVIDETFRQVREGMLALSETERASICLGMLERDAEAGETVVPSRRDRGAVERILKGFTKAPLTLSDRDADIDSGFLLAGEGYEKDCSFSALLEDFRAAEETGVAAYLFGAKGGQS